jgi:hypothetical protein
MQVGLRTRLRGRPSFYDLIKQRSIDQLSIATAKLLEEHQTVVASSVPLPTSPAKPTTIPVYTAVTDWTEADTKTNNAVEMVPVSLKSPIRQRLELLADFEPAEEPKESSGCFWRGAVWSVTHYGIYTEFKLTQIVKGSIYSVSGYVQGIR